MGFVYVATNSCFDGMVKIGCCSKIDERMKTLSNTSVPQDFKCEFYIQDIFSAHIELEAHKILEGKRISKNKEFFRCSSEEATKAVRAAQLIVNRRMEDIHASSLSNTKSSEKNAKGSLNKNSANYKTDPAKHRHQENDGLITPKQTEVSQAIKSLPIFWGGIQQGVLEILPDKTWRMQLNDGAQSFSLSFPKKSIISGTLVQQWFENLLPEEHERLLAERRFGVRRGDAFGLLEKMGWDVAGAVQVGDKPHLLIKPEQVLKDVLTAAISNCLPHPYEKIYPISLADAAERFSLAGTQTKVGVVSRGGEWRVPPSDHLSTHLFKPEFSKWRGVAVAEAFGQQLAHAIGLPAAQAQLIFVDNIPGVVVKRYDRIVGADGLVHRLHQEDLCQALGLSSEEKYDEGNTPSRISAFTQLARMQGMANNVIKFQNALIFQILLGNADAHLKNFSLLFTEQTELAPVYDSVPTSWFEAHRTPALHVGQARDVTQIFDTDWHELADEFGVSHKSLIKRRDTCAQKMANQLPQVVAQLKDVLSKVSARDDVVQTQMDVLSQGSKSLAQRLPTSNVQKFRQTKRM